MPRFAVVRRRGPAWEPSGAMRDQEGWNDHAAFMDALAADGFVVVGGPLEGDERFLFMIEAEDERSLRSRLEADPWTPAGLLVIESVAEWTILLEHST